MVRMNAPTFPYRNKANDLVGELTHEQAAVFPDVLELVVAVEEVDAIDTPEPTPTPVKASK